MAEEIGVLLSLQGIRDFLKGLESAQIELIGVAKQVTNVIGDLKQFESEIKKIAPDVDFGGLNTDISDASSKLDKFGAELKDTLKGYVETVDGAQLVFTESFESMGNAATNASFDNLGNIKASVKALREFAIAFKELNEAMNTGSNLAKSFQLLVFAIQDFGKLDVSANSDAIVENLTAIAKALAEFQKSFTLEGSADLSGKFFTRLESIATDLKAVGAAISFFGRSTTVESFRERVQLVVDGLKILGQDDSVTAFVNKITKYRKALEDLRAVVEAVAKIANNKTLAKLLDVDTTEAAKSTQAVKDSVKEITQQRTALVRVRENAAKRATAAQRLVTKEVQLSTSVQVANAKRLAAEESTKLKGLITRAKAEIQAIREPVSVRETLGRRYVKANKEAGASLNTLTKVIQNAGKSELAVLNTLINRQQDRVSAAQRAYNDQIAVVQEANVELRRLTLASINAEEAARQDVTNAVKQQLALQLTEERAKAAEVAKLANSEFEAKGTLLKAYEGQYRELTKQQNKLLAETREEVGKLAAAQNKLNVSYKVDTLKASTSALSRYIGRVIEARNESKSLVDLLRVGLGTKVQVAAIQALGQSFNLLTAPIRISIGLFRTLKKEMLSLPVRITKAAVNDLIRVLSTFGAELIRLRNYILKLPFRAFDALLKLAVKTFGAFGNLLITIVKRLANFSVNIIKAVAKFSTLLFIIKAALAPFNALINIFNKLVAAVGRFTGMSSGKGLDDIAGDSSKLGKTEKALDEIGDEAKQSEREVSELNQTIIDLSQTSNSLNINKGLQVNTKKAIAGIAGLVVAYKSLQAISNLVRQGLQHVRFAVQSLVGGAFQAAAEYEQLTLSLTALTKLDLKDQGVIGDPANAREFAAETRIVNTEVQSLLKWTRALAIQSPFEEKNVAQVLKYGLALGFTVDESKVLTQSVTDFAAATGASADQMKSIIRALGQMKANTILAKEELNQLAEAGFRNPLGALAEGLGLSTADTLQAITDKAISADAAITILNRRMQSEFSGAALKATQTLSGLVSTLQSLRENVSREFFTPVFDVFKPLIAAFTGVDQIEGLLETARAYGEVFANRVYKVVENTIRIFALLRASVIALDNAFGSVLRPIVKFVATTGVANIAIAVLVTGLIAAVPAILAMISPLGLVVAAMITFGRMAITSAEAIKGFVEIVNNAFTGKQSVSDAIDTQVKESEKSWAAYRKAANDHAVAMTSAADYDVVFGGGTGEEIKKENNIILSGLKERAQILRSQLDATKQALVDTQQDDNTPDYIAAQNDAIEEGLVERRDMISNELLKVKTIIGKINDKGLDDISVDIEADKAVDDLNKLQTAVDSASTKTVVASSNMTKALTTIPKAFFSAADSAVQFWHRIKPGLESAYNLVVGFINNTQEALGGFVTNVYTYGKNIGISLANGISAAIGAVVNAIQSIASVISYWLSPGSPPKALPDIDRWGTAAANEFLGGFNDADFELIEDYGSTIESLISAIHLDPADFDVEGITLDFANLINTLSGDEIGDQTAIETYIKRLMDATGEAGDDFMNLANEYVSLAKEQVKLNTVTNEYNEALAAANAQLDDLSREETFAEQSKELENLNKALNNQYLTSEQREALELKRRRVLAEMQKADVDEQQSVVDGQKEQLALLKQRLGLASKFGEDETGMVASAGNAAKALKALKEEKIDDIGASLTEGLETALEPISNIKDALGELSLPEFDLAGIFTDAKVEIEGKIQGLKDTFAALGLSVDNAKVAIGLFAAVLVTPLILKNLGTLSALLKGVGAAAGIIAGSATGLLLAGAAIAAIGAGIVLFADKITPELLTNISDGFDNLKTSVSEFYTSYQAGLGGTEENGGPAQAFADLEEAFTSLQDFDPTTYGLKLGASVALIKDQIITNLVAAGVAIRLAVAKNITGPFMEAFAIDETGETPDTRTFIVRIRDGIIAVLTETGTTIKTAIQTFITDNVVTPFNDGFALDSEANIGTKILNGIKATLSPIATAIPATFSELIDVEAIKTTLTEKIIEPFNIAFSEAEGKAIGERLIAGIQAAFTAAEISIDLSELFDIETGAFSGVIDSIKGAFEGLKGALPTALFKLFSDTFKTFTANMKESNIVQLLAELSSNLLTLGTYITVALTAILGAAVVGFGVVLTGIFEQLPIFLSAVLLVINGIIGGVVDFVRIFIAVFTGGDIQGAVLDFVGSLGDIFLGLLAAIGSIAAALITTVINVFSTLGPLAIDAIDSVIAIIADTLPPGVRDALAGAFEVVKQPIETVLDLLKSFGEVAFGAIESATNFASNLTGLNVPNPFAPLVEALKTVPDAIEALKEKLTEFASFAEGINITLPFSDALSGVFGRDNKAKDEAESAADGVSEAYIGKLDENLEAAEVSIDASNITSDITSFEQVGIDQGEAIIEGEVKGIEGAIAKVDTALDSAGETIKEGWNEFWGTNSPSKVAEEELGVPIGEGIIVGIQKALSNIDILSGLQGEAEDAQGTSLFGDLLAIDPQQIVTFQETFSTAFGNVITALQDFIEEFNDEVEDFFDELIDYLKDQFDDIVDLVKDTLALIIEMLVAFHVQVTQLLSALMDAVATIMERFVTIMEDTAKRGIKAFLDALEGFGDAVKEKLIEELGFLTDEGEGTLLQYMYDAGYAMGEAVMNGIVAGINNALPATVTAASDAVDDIISGMENAGGISSPSKVTLEGIGKPLMQGVALGIIEGSKSLAETSGKAIDGAVLAAKAQVDSARFSGFDIGIGDTQAAIAGMQNASNKSVINNTNYTMNMTVKESQQKRVRRNFSKMKNLRTA